MIRCLADESCIDVLSDEYLAQGGQPQTPGSVCLGDADGDGADGGCEQCPNDPNKTEPGICGCGTPDTDSDNDGTPDCNDGCPDDPDKTEPAICGCGVPETDSDNDGTPDCNDGCPDDPDKTEPGICGCGVSDVDSDGDGVPDCNDICPGFDDNVDTDEDGVPDGCDNCALPNPDQADCQPNGVGDVCDIADGTSQDCNTNEIPDECDIRDGTSLDENDNGIPDECEAPSVVPPHAEPGGPACSVPADCTGAWLGADCSGGTCYAPKNRYVSIDPTANDVPVAYLVEITEAVDYPTAQGRTWWVSEPLCYDYPNGDVVQPTPADCEEADRFGWVSTLSTAPVTRVWVEVPVHITGCGLVPVVTYSVRASADNGTSFSEALIIGTAHDPEGPSQSWGDITGGPASENPGLWLPPDGSMNFGDVGNAIRTFENRSEETGFPPRVWVDVEINQVVNLADIQFIVNAFEGVSYADLHDLEFIGLHPGDCP